MKSKLGDVKKKQFVLWGMLLLVFCMLPIRAQAASTVNIKQSYLSQPTSKSDIKKYKTLRGKIRGMKTKKSSKYPDYYATGKKVTIGINLSASAADKENYVYIKNTGNSRVKLLGVSTGMKLKKATSLLNKAGYEIRNNNTKVFMNGDGGRITLSLKKGKVKSFTYTLPAVKADKIDLFKYLGMDFAEGLRQVMAVTGGNNELYQAVLGCLANRELNVFQFDYSPMYKVGINDYSSITFDGLFYDMPSGLAQRMLENNGWTISRKYYNTAGSITFWYCIKGDYRLRLDFYDTSISRISASTRQYSDAILWDSTHSFY